MGILFVFVSCYVILQASGSGQNQKPLTYSSVSVGKTFMDNNLHGINLQQLLASAENNPLQAAENTHAYADISPNQFLSPVGGYQQQSTVNAVAGNPVPQVQYGSPQPQPQYFAPAQQQSIVQYAEPQQAVVQYNAPQPQQIVQLQPQSQQQPVVQYNAPQTQQIVQYAQPIPQYNAPVQAQPISQYAPQFQAQPISQYSAPVQAQPISQYAPQIQPQSGYAAPVQQFQAQQYNPQPQYAPAAQIQAQPLQQYGPPPSIPQYAPAPQLQAQPSQQYGTPQIQYAPAFRDQNQIQYRPQQAVQFSNPIPAQQFQLPATIPAAVPNQPLRAVLQGPATNTYGPPRHTPGAPLQSYQQRPVQAVKSQYGPPTVADNRPPVVKKHISVHLPPKEVEQQPQRIQEPLVIPKREKHYKIIFIKAPTVTPEQPQIPVIPPEPEQKTLVYVLVKKPEQQNPIVVPTPEPATPSKPEVYFIRYKSDAVNQIGQQQQAGGYSQPTLTPIQDYAPQQQFQPTFAPVQEFAPQQQQFLAPIQENAPQQQQFLAAAQVQQPAQNQVALFAPIAQYTNTPDYPQAQYGVPAQQQDSGRREG